MSSDQKAHLTNKEAKDPEKRHGQIHEQHESHFHGHNHSQIRRHTELNGPCQEHSSSSEHHGHIHAGQHGGHDHYCHGLPKRGPIAEVLTIRSHSGISGDILLCGLAALWAKKQNLAPGDPEFTKALHSLCQAIMPELAGCLKIARHAVASIYGWQAQVSLPHAHEHRHLGDIQKIIASAAISENARQKAGQCFEFLAACEAEAHGVGPEEVHFHEVGALDSILDICLTCELFDKLGNPNLRCGPLPLADGEINCAHGVIPAPAPAVLRLLEGIPVRPFAGDIEAGELVTPTGIALLRCLGASFGSWPAFNLTCTALVYGQKVFNGAANGVIFALGQAD